MRRGEEDKKNLIELTQMIALINMLDKQEGGETPNAVQLSTLHASKGLVQARLPDRCRGGSATAPRIDGTGQAGGRAPPDGTSASPARSVRCTSAMPSGASRRISSPPSRRASSPKWARTICGFTGGKSASEPDKASSSARLAAMKAMLAGNRPRLTVPACPLLNRKRAGDPVAGDMDGAAERWDGIGLHRSG